MAVALNPVHLKQYKDIVRLLLKYGQTGLAATRAATDSLPGDEFAEGREEEAEAQELAADLERMGPVYVKLGQVLSSRPDLVPPAYVRALSRLQDDLQPFPFEQVRETIEDELGVRFSKAFRDFDEKPMATASLGQVHKAVLRGGRDVVVKVQRPGIRKQIGEDFDALAEVAQMLDGHTDAGRRYRFGEILEEFRRTLIRELDYRQEARNMTEIGRNLLGFQRIVVPEAIDDYTSSRVLTMDHVHGRKVTELGPLATLEMPGREMAADLLRAYLKQILVDGLFHADPHPGNVLVTYDARVALIDLGMVGRVTPAMREQILKLLLAIGEGRSDEAADLAIGIGEAQEEFDDRGFRHQMGELIARNQGLTVGELNIGRMMLEFTRTAGESGIRMPSELTMLSKAMLNLDEIGRLLDPTFDANGTIREEAAAIARQQLLASVTPGGILSAAIESREFVSELPARANRILDNLANNRLKIEVEAIDEATLILGFQKVANRITVGLVLAALIVGAAMLMRIQTAFRLFGYPGLAMLCFLAAAGGGSWLLVTILLTDRSTRNDRN